MFRKHPRKGFKFKSSSANRFSQGEVALQITSLVDIFTILLVFLLKTTASSDVTVTPATDIQLSSSNQSDLLQNALKIEISQTSIRVEDQNVLNLQDGKIETDTGPIVAALEAYRGRQRELASLQNAVAPLAARALIFSDQKTQSGTLLKVLNLLENSGFEALQLGTLKLEEAL